MRELVKAISVFVVVYVMIYAAATGLAMLNLWLNSSWQQAFFENWRWWNIFTSPIDSLVYAYKLHHGWWACITSISTFIWSFVITGSVFRW